MKPIYTNAAAAVLDTARQTAAAGNHGYIGTEHLLYALLCADTEAKSVASHLLTAHGISAEAAAVSIRHLPALTEKAQPIETPMLRRILRRAETEATRFPTVPGGTGTEAVIGTEHLLFALLCETDSAAARLLAAQNIPLHELYGDILSFLSAVTAEGAILSDSDDTKRVPARRDSQTPEPPDVMRFLHDLGAERRQGTAMPIIGREEELALLLQILSRSKKNNACLVGDAGVGKTAIVEALAKKLQTEEVPPHLRGKRIYALDIAALIGGTRFRGDFEERMRAVIAFFADNPTAVLFVDEMHLLMGAGAAEGAPDAANLLKPALSRGSLQMIGATTVTEFRRFIAADSAMARRFQEVTVAEPTKDDAYHMLLGARDAFQTYHRVTLPDETLRAAVTLSVRYLPDRRLPDKAFDLLDDACAKKAMQQTQQTLSADPDAVRDAALARGDLAAAEAARERIHTTTQTPREPPPARPSVTPHDLAGVITAQTHIPVTELADAAHPAVSANALYARLSSDIRGQPQAIAAVTAAYRRLSAGLQPQGKPYASFLFHGPTGVGKTALAKSLALALFGEEDALLRFDMSEYQERHTVSALIGAPPGYVGYEAGGTLTEAVHRRPFSVVLFDEIEKAHPDVLRIFLQILDAGHLTDSHGRKIDFSHTILVMTTNEGITQKKQPLGFAAADTHEPRTDPTALFSAFPRELLNRFDAIIPFLPLRRDDLLCICRQQIDALVQQVAEKGIVLRVTPPALQLLCDMAYVSSADFGARPVHRTVANAIEVPLSERLAAQTLRPGDTVTVRARKGVLQLTS